MNRNDIITEAQRWIGTPYRHQASLKGVGSCVACGALLLAKNLKWRRLTRQIGQKRRAANRWQKRLCVT